MGNRESLLEGARQCILEKGYARTTARDIASAAGVSLAAIGYHFGSKEALLTEALLSTGEHLGDVLDEALKQNPDRLDRVWAKVLRVFEDRRELLAASVENVSQAARLPAVAEQMRAAQREAIEELAELTKELRPDTDAEEQEAVASLLFTLLNGLALVWLIDPDSAPTGRQVAIAISSLAEQAPATGRSRSGRRR